MNPTMPPNFNPPSSPPPPNMFGPPPPQIGRPMPMPRPQGMPAPRPNPVSPYGPPQGGQGGQGFKNFVSNSNFLQKIHNPNFPQPGTGTHVPVWLSPKLANSVLAQHGQTGHAIPHPNIDLNDITK